MNLPTTMERSVDVQNGLLLFFQNWVFGISVYRTFLSR